MRWTTRRSNNAVVSVCWPVIVSSIGSIVIVRFGCFGSGLASFDSSRARNAGSLPVCATRLSVASASAFSKVCGSDDEHAASSEGRVPTASAARDAVSHPGERSSQPIICIPA